MVWHGNLAAGHSDGAIAVDIDDSRVVDLASDVAERMRWWREATAMTVRVNAVAL